MNLNSKVYSLNDLLINVNGRLYVVNLDENKSVWTHWIAFYVNGNNVTYFNMT